MKPGNNMEDMGMKGYNNMIFWLDIEALTWLLLNKETETANLAMLKS